MKEKILIWIAWLLPRDLVYWCAIRVMANASMGEYSSQNVPDLKVMEALKRWPLKRHNAQSNQQQL